MKVNFVIAGTQKGGTTALDKYLRFHPDITMAKVKEVHYFDNESYFKNGPDYSKYHSFFENNVKTKCLGESTPIYMYWYGAPRRIWEYNPDMKFIIVLRDPAQRAYSHWNHQREKFREKRPFWEAINNEEATCREFLPLQCRYFSYIDRGFYTEQLRRIWHFFPKEQTLVLKSEDLKGELAKTLSTVARFLEIEEFPDVQPEVVHARRYVSEMSQAELEFLKDKFLLEIKELESIMGWDLSHWLQRG